MDTITEDPTPNEAVETATPDFGRLERSVDELRRDLLAVEQRTTDAAQVSDVSPLLQYRSFGEAARAVYREELDPAVLNRALADQITPNNPGVIPEGWVKDVKGIVDRGAITIDAFGRAPLPDGGMDINWPYYDGDWTLLVGAQATEKTEITTVRVDLLRGTATIGTYAGGSDISYQLIMRSDPSYLDAYMRIMTIGYSVATDSAFNAQMVAAATAGTPWNPAGGDLAGLREAILKASIAVQAATGQPATFAVVATDVFDAIAPLLPDDAYPVQNVSGAINAASLAPRVSGVPVLHDPWAAAGTFLVSNQLAASWHGSGAMTATEEDVANLGRNQAVWGMGVGAAYLPAGIISIAAAVSAASSKK